jgi:hypothetical protein
MSTYGSGVGINSVFCSMAFRMHAMRLLRIAALEAFFSQPCISMDWLVQLLRLQTPVHWIGVGYEIPEQEIARQKY